MHLFRSDWAAEVSLSGREVALLEAVRIAGPTGACAADLQRVIGKEIGKEPRLATLYGAITDLERKGLLQIVASDQPTNGGRPRRLFALTKNGRLALTLGEAMANVSPLVPA